MSRAAYKQPRWAVYLTLSLDDDAGRAEANVNHYLEGYYQAPAAPTGKRQAVYAGPVSALGERLTSYWKAGATHCVLRFAGDHLRHLEHVVWVRSELGWWS